MDTFFHADPPLAYSDHIHFTQPGYEQWGRALGAALLDDHARWTQTDPTARTSGHRP